MASGLRGRLVVQTLALVLVLLGSAPAMGKPVPLTVGGQISYRTVHELRVVGYAQWAFTDALALRVQAGPALLAGPAAATLLGGPVFSLDALTWVPSVYLLGGLRGPALMPAVQAGLELKRYISLHTGITLGLAAEWLGSDRFGGVANFGVARSF